MAAERCKICCFDAVEIQVLIQHCSSKLIKICCAGQRLGFLNASKQLVISTADMFLMKKKKM